MSASSALAVLRRALPSATERERQFVWGVTGFETGWGTGWKDNALAQVSNNWGAVHAPTGEGFLYTDHRSDGTPYTATFAVYPTPEAGAAGAAKYILKPNVKAVLASGDAYTAVSLMRANGYFVASADLYRAGVLRTYNSAIASSGEPALLSFEKPNPTLVWPFLAIGGVVAWTFRKRLGL
jgi:hypothetical protein